ncbi:MAG: YcjF family protein [Halothece sp.]
MNQRDQNSSHQSDHQSWIRAIFSILQNTSNRFQSLLPFQKATDQVKQWFTVSEEEVAEILTRVREELPTTEVILAGKPQSGKSSIVRGLTGVSDEIIGQGFRPHTQHTERYPYPSEDLPLVIFTDTIGLGDIQENTPKIIEELEASLEASADHRARILILTVKINDFATETLQKTAQALRKKYPNVPVLLTVTCLHEGYPPEIENHPEYPPNFETIERPLAKIKETFSGLSDRAVLIDFTLEEDGYTPVFYGIEALRDSLGELLPEAEAKAMYDLLDTSMGDQLGNLYRDVGRRYILAFSIIAATVAAVPLPFATMPVLTTLQVSLVGVLGKLYGQPLSFSQAGGVVSAIAGGFFAQLVGRELIKFIPGLGSAIAASWAAAYTWALGEGACVYFGDLMGGKKPDPDKIQSVMQEAFTEAKERFKKNNTLVTPLNPPS